MTKFLCRTLPKISMSPSHTFRLFALLTASSPSHPILSLRRNRVNCEIASLVTLLLLRLRPRAVVISWVGPEFMLSLCSLSSFLGFRIDPISRLGEVHKEISTLHKVRFTCIFFDIFLHHSLVENRSFLTTHLLAWT